MGLLFGDGVCGQPSQTSGLNGREVSSRGKYFRRGINVGCGTVAALAVVWFIGMGFFYDGKCGGFIPEISAPMHCSFLEYEWADVLTVGMVLLVSYWPFVVAIFVVPPLIGYLLDRRLQDRSRGV